MESDSLGRVEVPIEALYGAQTQRALENFPVRDQRTVGDHPNLVRGMMAIKQAAARTNGAHGFLDASIADAIASSAERVAQEGLWNLFPVHFLHGGGGTSANMNANEVLANMAEESLGGERGQYRHVHPNDHVNMHQSTNDVYPSACHIAILLQWRDLRRALEQLAKALAAKARGLSEQVRIARTCLQDAVEIGFGDLLGGYEGLLERSVARLGRAVDDLHCINMGGTIVGRKQDVPQPFLEAIVPAIAELLGDREYRQARNLFDAAQNPDPVAAVSAELAILARGMIKIGKDFRLMASGPECGLGEICLPAVQPGSSAMPGKINPVIPEFLVQTGLQAVGHDAACQAAVDHGELDLNVWESLMVFNVLEAMRLLAEGVTAFDSKCVRGFTVNAGRNADNARTLAPLLTKLMHQRGYSEVSEMWQKAGGDVEELRRLLSEET
jgi:aspartate ammonia-lyase